MARYSFPYTRQDIEGTPAFPEGHSVYRPVVNVILTNGSHSVTCRAIVDSGADYCMFPKDFLPDLGLEFNDLPSSGGHGVGGGSAIHFTNLDMAVENIPPRNVYIGFMEAFNGVGVGLLGHYGFLDRFVAIFNHRQKTLVLEF